MTSTIRRAPWVCAAALLTTAALAPTPARPQGGEDPLITSLKTAESTAVTAAITKRTTLNEISAFVAIVKPGVELRIDTLRGTGKPDDTLMAAELARTLKDHENQAKTLEGELATADAAALEATRKRQAAERLYAVLTLKADAPLQVTTAPAPAAQLPLAPPARMPGDNHPCSLVAPFEEASFSPVTCLQKPPAAGTVTIGDRPIQRQGTSAQLTSTGTASAVTLRYAQNSARRERIKDSGQALSAFGWNLGLAASTAKDADTAFAARLSENADGRRLFESDKLDERLKLLGGLSFNYYGSSSKAAFESSVTDVVEKAIAACQGDKFTQDKATCGRDRIYHWIMDNSGHRQALNEAFWGSAKADPIRGAGLQLELAYPRFKYYELDLPQIAAGGLVPTGFTAGKPSDERKLHVTALGYLFWKVGERSSVIPSITYKRVWSVPDDFANIDVCTPDASSPVFKSSCQKVNIAAPVLENSYFLGAEWRHYGLGRGILPAFGIAPRYTVELSRGRHSFDMPIWLALDEKQTALNAGIRLIAEVGGETLTGKDRKADIGLAFFLGTTFNLSEPRK